MAGSLTESMEYIDVSMVIGESMDICYGSWLILIHITLLEGK